MRTKLSIIIAVLFFLVVLGIFAVVRFDNLLASVHRQFVDPVIIVANNMAISYPPIFPQSPAKHDHQPGYLMEKPIPQPSGTIRIPVLIYHHVGPIPPGTPPDYYVTPGVFALQLKYLQDNNYQVITPQQFYDQIASGNNPTTKEVLLTFDDGYLDNYLYAYPLLKQYGYSGTFAIIVGKLTDTDHMTAKQLLDMSNNGMIISSHSITHPDLARISNAKLQEELGNSKMRLENITGKQVNVLIYPGCSYNGNVISVAQSIGYKMAFTCGSKIDNKLAWKYRFYRIHIYDRMDDFVNRLAGIDKYPY